MSLYKNVANVIERSTLMDVRNVSGGEPIKPQADTTKTKGADKKQDAGSIFNSAEHKRDVEELQQEIFSRLKEFDQEEENGALIKKILDKLPRDIVAKYGGEDKTEALLKEIIKDNKNSPKFGLD